MYNGVENISGSDAIYGKNVESKQFKQHICDFVDRNLHNSKHILFV